MDSMQKYNNCSVVRELNGTMKIYDKESNIIWTGYVTDIKEVMTELNKKWYLHTDIRENYVANHKQLVVE